METKHKILTFLSFTALLSGCFQQCKEDTSKNAVNTNDKIGQSIPVQAPRTLAIGNASEPSSLDPQIASGLTEAKILQGLFEGLLVSNSRTTEPMPGVAKTYSVSKDGLIYTFHLRDNARWSNGDRVVAKDFVNTVQRGLSKSLASPWIDQYLLIKNAKNYYNGTLVEFNKVGIFAIDDSTLKIELEKPVSYFASLLTHWAWSPIQKQNINSFGDFYDRNNRWTRVGHIVSNGPFLLESNNIGDKVVLVKNPYYWEAAHVAIDRIEFPSGLDINTEENMFQCGLLDITDNVPSEKISKYKQEGLLKTAPTLGSSYFCFNCNRAPFDDVRVRKALSLAIDRHQIGVLRGRGEGFEAYSLVPPGTANYESSSLFSSNIKEARKLLSEAGFPEGKGFPKVTILYNSSTNWKMIAEAAQEMWRKNLGIEVDLHGIEWGVFVQERRSHNFDICRGGWIGDYNDATTFLDLFKSDNNNNHPGWKNSEFDKMLAQADVAGLQHSRKTFLENAEKILIEDMPIIPLYFDATCHLVNPNLGGWHANILDWHPLKYIYRK